MDEMEVGFGVDSQKDINELAKSLAVGYAVGTTDQTGFGATRLESLEKTLKMAVAEEKTAKFWKALQKSKGNSTVEEFSSVSAIGDANFYVEGGIPEEYDEEIKREFETTKYIGAVGKVPNVALSVKSMVDNMALVKKLKAIAIIRACNRKSFFGNSTNVSVEWNGYLTQFLNRVKNPTQNIIDLQGKCLNAETLAEVSQIVGDNWGDPNNIQGWISRDAFKNYAKELIKTKTFMVGNAEIRDIVSVPKTFEVGDGSGSLETDIYLRQKGQTYFDQAYPKVNSNASAFSATNTKAPATLTSGQASLSIDVLTGSTLPNATYDYCVVPINQYGAGAGFELKSNVVGSNKKVTFTLADNGSTYPATAFEIYRKLSSKLLLTDYRYVSTIKTGGVDDGTEVPETTYGFFWDWNFDQVLDFKQLLPMVAMPLATIDDSIRWLQKLYGTPILYNPNKMVLIKNIGTTSWS